MSVRRSRQNLARSREIQYQFYFGKVNGNSVVSSLISLAAISDFDFVPILFTYELVEESFTAFLSRSTRS